MAFKQPKTDPELIRQLNEGANAVEAVFMLRPEDPLQVSMEPHRTEEVAQEVIERVKEEVGVAASRVNVFRNLGSFVVAAPAPFLRRLMEQPEIASAMANRQAKRGYSQPRGGQPQGGKIVPRKPLRAIRKAR